MWAISPAAIHHRVFTPAPIDALEHQDDPSKNLIIPYGYVQGDMNLSDSQRTNVPDFQGQDAIAGLLVAGGIASAQLEVDFFGNQPLYEAPITDPVSGVTTTPPSYNNTVELRQAQLNLSALKLKSGDNSYTTIISLGGIRVGSAQYTAPDAANTPTGFERQDGGYLQEKMKFGNQWSVILGFGAFNTLYGSAPGSHYTSWGNNPPITMQNFWLSTSLNPSLAYLGSLNATYFFSTNRSLNLIAIYDAQNNAPYSDVPLTGLQTAGALSEVRNVNHTEASLLYNDIGLFGNKGVINSNGVSFWYEREENSRTQLATGNLANGFVYTNGLIDDAQVATLYGFGIAADSEPYLTNMLQKGDRITYAAAYTLVTSALGAPSLLQTYQVNQPSASIGYAVNTFEIALNWEYSFANTNSFFTDKNGNPQNNEMTTYITAAYNF